MRTDAPRSFSTHLSAHCPPNVFSTLSPHPLGAIRYTPSCPTKMNRPWKHPFFYATSPSVHLLLLRQGGVSSPSNIFSSWSGTEHIMDGSVKVIILLGWCPETIFLHLRVSVSLPILWIFYQLLNHGSTIGKVTCLAQWYENTRYQSYAYQGTQIWARPLNSMTKCSFIQPHQLPSGVGLASFCMHTLPRNLSEKEIAAAKKSASDSNRFSQRWRVSRQQEM